jgi:hypothetical protein
VDEKAAQLHAIATLKVLFILLILRILSKICGSFNPLMHKDGRILEFGEKKMEVGCDSI